MRQEHNREAPTLSHAEAFPRIISKSRPIRCLPWDRDAIKFGFNGYPCGLTVAVECAINFARDVVEMEAEAAGLDWASQVQRWADATLEERMCHLPPSAHQDVYTAAARTLASIGQWT